MSRFVPHLLLFTELGSSQTGTLLRNAGYMVTSIGALHETRLDAVPEAEAVVVELGPLATIATVRNIEERYGRNIVVIVISQDAEAVQRALPFTTVVRFEDAADDLVSTIDLSLAAHQMQQTG